MFAGNQKKEGPAGNSFVLALGMGESMKGGAGKKRGWSHRITRHWQQAKVQDEWRAISITETPVKCTDEKEFNEKETFNQDGKGNFVCQKKKTKKERSPLRLEGGKTHLRGEDS